MGSSPGLGPVEAWAFSRDFWGPGPATATARLLVGRRLVKKSDLHMLCTRKHCVTAAHEKAIRRSGVGEK